MNPSRSQSSRLWVRQHLPYFPDSGRWSFRSCSSLLCYWDGERRRGPLISSCIGSLCREAAGWCNAVCAAALCSYQMHCTEERVRNQCNIHFYNHFRSHHQKPHFSPSVMRCHVFMQLSLVLLRNEQSFWKARCGFMDHNLWNETLNMWQSSSDRRCQCLHTLIITKDAFYSSVFQGENMKQQTASVISVEKKNIFLLVIYEMLKNLFSDVDNKVIFLKGSFDSYINSESVTKCKQKSWVLCFLIQFCRLFKAKITLISKVFSVPGSPDGFIMGPLMVRWDGARAV